MTMQLLNDLEIRCKNFTNECSFTTKLDNERNLTLHEIEHCIVTKNEKLHIQNKNLRSMISNKLSRTERGETFALLDDSSLERLQTNAIDAIVGVSQASRRRKNDAVKTNFPENKVCNEKCRIGQRIQRHRDNNR